MAPDDQSRLHLRAADTDRARVVDMLRVAHRDGRITAAELAQRCDAVGRSRTYGDLDAAVADLPGTPPSVVLTALAEPAVGSSPNRPLVIAAGWSSAKRSGRWTVPPFLQVAGDVGVVRLDLREAQAQSDVIDVAVSGGAGMIRIILSDNWAADTTCVAGRWGRMINRSTDAPGPGGHRLTLHGSAGAGSIIVRYATNRERRAAGKASRRPDSRGRSLGERQSWVERPQELPNADDLR